MPTGCDDSSRHCFSAFLFLEALLIVVSFPRAIFVVLMPALDSSIDFKPLEFQTVCFG